APTQVPPVWQTAPAQQALPTAPQFSQVLGALPAGLLQPRPALQVPPPPKVAPQQAWPIAPQGSQRVMTPPAAMAVWQERPAPHWLPPPPWQQAAPEVPHAMHMAIAPPEQRVFGAVQVPPPPPPVAQHASPSAPQAFMPMPHAPAMQVPRLPPQ